MNYEKATREELLKIVNDLQLENNSLKLSYERGVARLKSIEGVLSQKDDHVREVLEKSWDAGYKLNL